MKKILFIIFALVISLIGLNFGIVENKNTYANEPETTDENGYFHKDGFHYKIEKGKAVVYGVDGEPDVITIPEKLNGYIVESMRLITRVKVVNIPKTVKNIIDLELAADSSFADIREKIEEINVDKNNPNFASIEGVLYNKDVSKMLVYPRYRKAKKYVEPSSITGGYKGAVRDYVGCKYLEEITFSSNKNIKSLGHMAFCENLKIVNIPANIIYTDSGDYEEGTFYNCTNLTTVNIGKNSKLKYIYKETFELCSRLKSISIPKSVKEIGHDAFHDCTSLKKVTLHKGLKTIGYYTFYNCKSLKTIKLPKGIKNINSNTFNKCVALKSVKLPKGLKKIEKYAFYKCKKLKKITIPKGVKKIEKYAFKKTKIKKVKIPKSVKKLSKKAFNKGCKIKRVK